MMKVFDCAQGSEEWFKIKCGIPSASEFDKIVTIKGEPSKQREKYLLQLAGERVSKIPEETYTNGIMEKAKLCEDEARKYYEFAKRVKVSQVGFILQEKPGYGCSPDGMVGKPGLFETKCPLRSTHVKYLLTPTLLVTDYFQQCQGQLLVTGRDWVDLMSYSPGIKPLIIRVKRDNGFLGKLRKELGLFCAELDRVVRKIK